MSPVAVGAFVLALPLGEEEFVHPANAMTSAMPAQKKVLEFFIFINRSAQKLGWVLKIAGEKVLLKAPFDAQRTGR